MKLIIVSGDGDTLGEVKLSQQLLRRPDILSDKIKSLIEASLREEQQQLIDMRIVDNQSRNMLESLDDDATIMDVPLRLNEACMFDFDKHTRAITEAESIALEEHKKFTRLDSASELRKKRDERYKERPLNRIRYGR